jgi:hypothetical protein
LRLKGWGSPNSNEGTYTVVLYIYKYFVLSPFSRPNLLGWEGLRREGILDVIAVIKREYYHGGGHP